ncbi:hypothetical protein TH606_00430 [Thermodesulfatator autotrophicus]|uniref:Uncharacterized protein n=1 Tax=Thermodesulfatator autotrophicus TaxID=1795632 RepID=A0A177EA01_9BACT|nr:hypothetical protein TH606_00430 [Thermodesulfatator autotrophicus]
MPNTELRDKNKEKNNNSEEELGFCAKEGEYRPLKRGCPHPNDYCPHRKACLIYFISKEGGNF